MSRVLNRLSERGHEIASHGWSHTPPLKLSPAHFAAETALCRKAHSDFISSPLEGYRAALFSLDRPRLDQVVESGFLYDSSSSTRGRKALQIDLSQYQPMRDKVFRQGDFFEFQVGAPGYTSYFINGGGGTRILPWILTKPLLKHSFKTMDFYNFFVHPLDLSTDDLPLPQGLSWLSRRRILYGRATMMSRLQIILQELQAANFEFVTLGQLRRELLAPNQIAV